VVSVKNIAELGLDELILTSKPKIEGKNLECITVGLGSLSFSATSRVILKYGSWSIPQGIKQRISDRSPKICLNEVQNDGAAWIAG